MNIVRVAALAVVMCFASTAFAAEPGICERVRAEKINDGRSPAQRPFLKAKDAIAYNHPDELTALLADCVGVDQQDQYGWTLLHHAADRDRAVMARLLIARGAKRTIRNQDGQTAPQLARSPEMKAALGAPPAAAPAKASAGTTPAAPASRAAQCNARHHSSSALCSDGTCKMREYRKWQTCLKTGSYY
jgi:hypothetical protein